jgi:hypothetical protein
LVLFKIRVFRVVVWSPQFKSTQCRCTPSSTDCHTVLYCVVAKMCEQVRKESSGLSNSSILANACNE